MLPAEVIALNPRTAITFTPGVPPIQTRLLRYYEERWLGRRTGWIAAIMHRAWVLTLSSALLAMIAGFDFVLIMSSKDDPYVRARLPAEALKVLDAVSGTKPRIQHYRR